MLKPLIQYFLSSFSLHCGGHWRNIMACVVPASVLCVGGKWSHKGCGRNNSVYVLPTQQSYWIN